MQIKCRTNHHLVENNISDEKKLFNFAHYMGAGKVFKKSFNPFHFDLGFKGILVCK